MSNKKLSLNRETLRTLQADEMSQAAGAGLIVTLLCHTLVCPTPTTTIITKGSWACGGGTIVNTGH